MITDLKINMENGKDIFVFKTDDNFGNVLASYTGNHIAESTNYTDTFLVFDREVAKDLLSSGKEIVDLKANRDNPAEEVYVFKKFTE